MSTLSVMLASLAGLTLAPAEALPSEDVVTQSRVLNFAHEQLLSDEGVDALRQELAHAARMVCREQGNIHSRISREARDCAQTAYAQGLEQLELQVAQARATSRQYAQNSNESSQGTH